MKKKVKDLQAAKAKVEEDFEGPSSSDALQLLPQLKAALVALKSFVKEKAILSLTQALAIVKLLYPQVDIEAVDKGVAANCT
ncbi:hypothetical protein E2562_031568 [Oryza meyeriana var. granulata]|uniref:Uncharacterized protein n=1 Tax=Oryza meyeriana var. granulata TaxID=110450 RepID=A0A6G1CX00_9ORYZ|nr:hypothetical protein E2562_031568 [Oryza meyeriana var. granulata]